MARRHGWQFPYHAFQVVAIAVFFLLSVAFFTFFVPFLGKKLYEYVAVGVYSFLALSVLILYVRCTAIDPADPGILIGFDEQSFNKSLRDGGSLQETSKTALKTEEKFQKHKSTAWSEVGCFLCMLLLKEDCHKAEDISQQQADSNEALFCTLCNAEVRKFSKHCRSCDKCVDGFDHHCRWLNNCIGRKNYVTFLSLMGMGLFWLAVECGVGIAVLVRCFKDGRALEEHITERLGDGLTRIPFAIVVALCTALSLVASVPLGELFFFHMILIRKGITTYEYVVAMRTQSEPPWPSANEESHSLSSSPVSSVATAMSANSLGLQYRGAWCTPPRIFVDHKDEIIPHLEPGRIPSTVDPDNADLSEIGKRHAKRPVRISAWKLAKLDSNEAVRAAAKARASSSVLRPINSRIQYDADKCSSGNASSRSSTTGIGIPGETRMGNIRSSPLKSSYPPSRASREDLETCPHTPSNLTSHHATNTLGLPSASEQASKARHFNPIYQNSPWSGNESMASDSTMRAPPKRTSTSSIDNSRSSVYWDQEIGRFVSQNSGRYARSSGNELLYTGHSIFFGGPLLNEGIVRSLRNAGPSNKMPGGVNRRASDQLPVFSPKDSQNDRISRLP